MTPSWFGDTSDSWFRVGRFAVTTTAFFVALAVIGGIVSAIAPAGILAFVPGLILSGQAWRLVSWVVAGRLGFWTVLNLIFFYIFAGELEEQIGRVAMARLLANTALLLMLVTFVAGLIGPSGLNLAGLDEIIFIVFLLWIAEFPTRPIFFSIPAWVFGAALVLIQVLGWVASGSLIWLAIGLITALGVAVAAKREGLLSAYAWIPGRQRQQRAPRQSRAQKKSARVAQKKADAAASDRQRLDVLLDKINEGGMDSLSASDRRELDAIRTRMRGE